LAIVAKGLANENFNLLDDPAQPNGRCAFRRTGHFPLTPFDFPNLRHVETVLLGSGLGDFAPDLAASGQPTSSLF
jgi:hypothetical protein